MIKIPGTEEGLPAIEQAISEGINVNVTLLFSVEAYASVAEAYIRGSERRDGDYAHSVASFFVSRVDTEVDKRLAELGREELRGSAAVANARAAYALFKEVFLGERFAALRDRGCPVQRPLWASTGVKDPRYPETKYVDSLVAPHTVNTMPAPTLLACGEQLEVRGATADEDPNAELAALAEAGIDMGDVTDTLLRDGIAKFVDPFDKLIEGVELAREGIVTGRPPTIRSSIPDELEPGLIAKIEEAQAEAVAKRAWQRDESLWGGPGVPEIGDRLGWLTISEKMLEHAPELNAFVEQVKADGFTDAVLLGMGGSSLGPEVIRRSYGQIPGRAPPARARLDRPGRRAGSRARGGPRQDAVHRVVEVRRHGRDAVAHALLLRARRRRRAAASWRSPIPAARSWTSPASAVSARCSRQIPRSAGATRCCPTSGSCRRRSRG